VVEIDGRTGEGGGQILRTALSLSALLGTPFQIRNIRGNRAKKGLRAQHLAAVNAVKIVSRAQVSGDEIGSERLYFEPTRVHAGSYRFDIGTAGATPLVLQALIPPLLFAGAPSKIILTGGTHVPISPPFNYLNDVFFPLLAEQGIRVTGSIRTYGFYPRGGGEIEAVVSPQGNRSYAPPDLSNNKAIWRITGVSAVGNLPSSIAARQRQAALRVLAEIDAPVNIECSSVATPGHGTFVFLKAEGGVCRAGFSSIGIPGKRAETVGTEAAGALVQYSRQEGCVDPHLADQLVIYYSLAEGTTIFTTTEITSHLLTNLAVLSQFLGMGYRVEGSLGSPGKVSVKGIGFTGR
jgi:RNA 3'-terminal phosphate cyclase (ATP)